MKSTKQSWFTQPLNYKLLNNNFPSSYSVRKPYKSVDRVKPHFTEKISLRFCFGSLQFYRADCGLTRGELPLIITLHLVITIMWINS